MQQRVRKRHRGKAFVLTERWYKMLQTRYYTLSLDPGKLTSCIVLAQNEDGRDLIFELSGSGEVSIPEGSTATISGKKPDGNVYSAVCDYADNKVTVHETLQMTTAPGEWQATLKILYNEQTIATALIYFNVIADPTGGDLPSDSEMEGLVAQAAYYAENARSAAYGSPLTASTAAGMTDKTRVYVYTGSETGMSNGHWYYWNGSTWTDGGIYNAAAVQTDTTLAHPGMPADAKATGDAITAESEAREQEIADLKQDLEETYAEQDGTYPDMTVGTADSLSTDKFTSDSTPYLFRPSGGGVEVGVKEEDKIVGGTVNVNQHSESYLATAASASVDGDVVTITPNTSSIWCWSPWRL